MLRESDRDFKFPSPLQQSFDSSYPVMLRGDQSDMLQCYQLATNQVSLWPADHDQNKCTWLWPFATHPTLNDLIQWKQDTTKIKWYTEIYTEPSSKTNLVTGLINWEDFVRILADRTRPSLPSCTSSTKPMGQTPRGIFSLKIKTRSPSLRFDFVWQIFLHPTSPKSVGQMLYLAPPTTKEIIITKNSWWQWHVLRQHEQVIRGQWRSIKYTITHSSERPTIHYWLNLTE